MFVGAPSNTVALALITAALGQSPGDKRFDIVSVKPSAPDTHNSFMFRSLPGGAIRIAGEPLRMMIMDAYGVKAFQVSGGPDWIRTARWDVTAKADGFQSRIPRDQENAMLQAMMADRFQLRVHTEKKEMPVYALEVDKHGPKLTPHTGDERQFRPGYGSLIVKKGTIASLADWISRSLWRVVIDRTTGLSGEYDYALQWTPDPGEGGPEMYGLPPAPPETHPATNGPSIFTALREQLGLRLVAEKGPVKIVVIDSAEKPGEN